MIFKQDPGFFFAVITACVAIVVLVMIGFIFYTAFPTYRLMGIDFFLSTKWDYDEHQYGILILLVGTLLLTVTTIIIASPIGLLTAIYLSEWAPPSVEKIMRPMVELLVGIPSVVYGIFGFLVLESIFRFNINPFIDSILGNFPFFHNASPNDGQGYLLAGFILGIMILPTIMALSQEALRAVPQSYREASFALGATKWETIHRTVLPAASSGIVTSIVLGVMRAMGETMAVVMVIGGSVHMPRSLLDTGMTITSKILVDAGYYMTLPEPRSAIFALAFTLFCTELIFVALIRLVGKRMKGMYQ